MRSYMCVCTSSLALWLLWAARSLLKTCHWCDIYRGLPNDLGDCWVHIHTQADTHRSKWALIGGKAMAAVASKGRGRSQSVDGGGISEKWRRNTVPALRLQKQNSQIYQCDITSSAGLPALFHLTQEVFDCHHWKTVGTFKRKTADTMAAPTKLQRNPL